MNKNSIEKKRIYLDNAAATPIRREVLEAMMPFLTEDFGNPSSIHGEGVRARRAVDEARSSVARTLEIKPQGVIFTGNGTESNNLAILGHIKYLHKKGLAYADMEVVTTKIEHPSILGVMDELSDLGVQVKFVEVDERGIITIPALEAVLSPKTVMVTFAYANSEVGTVQPVLRLVRRVRKYEETTGREIKVHLDAAQAPLWLPCAFKQLGADTLALDAGKCNGPKGVGVLATRKNFNLLPIVQGGGQENGLRSGTENTAGIIGMSKALELAQADHASRAETVAKIRDEAIAYLQEKIPAAVVNGGKGEDRLANNINFSIPELDTEYAVIYLDTHGVACSTKSACAGAGGGESLVVKTITGDATRARSTIRFSLSEQTTLDDMKYAIDVLVEYCEKMNLV
ncbi:MAG: cysteine desulfurase [Candidatus Pacebacteria bacterium]|nr:cysteine desulfurase [Candidatus Paceibacterota bacterium]